MDVDNKLLELIYNQCFYHFCFDVTTGIVDMDIIDKIGLNHNKACGLSVPYKFDDLISNSLCGEYANVIQVADMDMSELSCENLLKVYESGSSTAEVLFYLPGRDSYTRLDYYMFEDEDTGHVMAYAFASDITEMERKRIARFGDLVKKMDETDDIIATAQMGIWHIYLFDGERPRMKASPKMCELLGIKPEGMTEEEIYEDWYSRIKPSSRPYVDMGVKQMIAEGFAERTYAWIHPVKKEIFVRCGGTATKVEGKGYILRGYHSDITEIVNNETKQKQLLEDALEEVKIQKQLLQEALDNYKEADYDRRRDFLTGLRNRQDMFELLQDVLSGKREKIRSMFMMDIDNFKMLNDHYGHTYGDECLKKIGDALRDYGRKNNLYFYRYGGEEILGICMDAHKEASVIANELVELIYKLNIRRDDLPTKAVTVSLGYTTDNSRYEKMIDKADEAMYQAKDRGKNRAVCYEDL